MYTPYKERALDITHDESAFKILLKEYEALSLNKKSDSIRYFFQRPFRLYGVCKKTLETISHMENTKNFLST